MKTIPFPVLAIILLAGLQGTVNAQYVLKSADTQYELFNYSKAIDLYEQAYKKKASLYTALRLAECNALVHDYKQTESWYAIAAGMPGSSIENRLNYARALQSNSKYSEAKAEYLKYISQYGNAGVRQGSLWLASCDSALKWMQSPVNVTVTGADFLNGRQADWAAVPYENGLVFVSDRDNSAAHTVKRSKPFLRFDGPKAPDKKSYGWTGNYYQRLYLHQKGADSVLSFPFDAGTDYHIGPASFTQNGNEIYFALTRVPKKGTFVNGISTINIEMYSSKKDSLGKWGAPVPFKYNNVNVYSVGDPFISDDGSYLLFVSDMPGGAGGTDIYMCLKTGDDNWEAPINLKGLNTEGNERSPYFDGGNTFYFSSDGYTGMGGLDIFSATGRPGSISKPVNLGYPFNSPQDDFAYRPVTDSTGYFSSNRLEGSGGDDIYIFHQPKKDVIFQLTGKVYDRNTRTPLANVIVSLRRSDGSTLKVETDSSGVYRFTPETDTVYRLTAGKTNYISTAAEISTIDLKQTTTLKRDLYLETVEIDKPIRLENIYYDFDKWNINADASAELDKLVEFLYDNMTVWIELGSHTDSRGNDRYNLELSQKRADAAVEYIISKGISRNRITAKGYGETQLLNKCANNVECSPDDHQLNRRTEFKIVKQ